jgi:hypothetical protein
MAAIDATERAMDPIRTFVTHFRRFVEAGNAAAILRRCVALAGDEARRGEAPLAGAHAADGQTMLPAIAEVVEVIDQGAARLQQLAQADWRSGCTSRLPARRRGRNRRTAMPGARAHAGQRAFRRQGVLPGRKVQARQAPEPHCSSGSRNPEPDSSSAQ